MEARGLAVALARGRIALGALAIAAPGLAARVMLGRGQGRGTAALARMLGGRDVALGLGVVIALDRGAPVRGWLEASALSDSVDLVACFIAREDIPETTFIPTVAFAGFAALAQTWLSRQLDPAPAAEPGHPEAVATGHSAEPPARASS